MMHSTETVLALSIVAIVLGIFLVPFIIYLNTLSATIKLCAPHNQQLAPGSVWRVLIPVYGLFWHFIMVGKIADTISRELEERNQEVFERPGYNMGITFLVLQLLGAIPMIGGLFSLAGLVCWVIYWVKINDYKRILSDTLSFSKSDEILP